MILNNQAKVLNQSLNFKQKVKYYNTQPQALCMEFESENLKSDVLITNSMHILIRDKLVRVAAVYLSCH